jgi:methylmalonyl-CoA/ethylmalonyl-CoA epimerase
MENLVGSGVVTQIGIVTRDIEKASRDYARIFGMEIPSWFWTDGYDEAGTEYRGEPTGARCKLAFFHFGQVDIELIEPDEGKSTWREFLDEKGEGIHHIAFVTAGMSARIDALAAEGIPLVQKGEYTGGRYAYLDATRSLKTVLELLENDAR